MYCGGKTLLCKISLQAKDSMSPLDKNQLNEITQITLGHYNQNAEGFREGTWDHDVTQNYQALLDALPDPGPHKILDLGCGPGRDLVYFKEKGHEPVGLEGSPTFVQMARKISGCAVWEQNFLSMDLPDNYFDGIFANASLFHVPRQELSRVLSQFHQTLKESGILFSSNPRGNEEGWHGTRYGVYMEREEYQTYLENAGFKVLHHYYRPTGKPRKEQPWLAVVSQKLGPSP